ncbi:hypothetical protein CLV53_104210 [Sediminibacterium magnilacihabitans]|jgi:hypothetical protein|nr:hypothetical protein CLV53_104210 [Sediminibacterium magnilacihabitans]
MSKKGICSKVRAVKFESMKIPQLDEFVPHTNPQKQKTL